MEKASPEKIKELFSQLRAEERLELLKTLEDNIQVVSTDLSPQPKFNELQIKEADWISLEMQEAIKLIQQYRGLYMTAVFLILGWVIGQIISSSISAANVAPGTQPSPFTLESMRNHGDIAVLLIGVGLINLLFMTLILEVYAQWRSLARYKFILGCELGKGKPAWRYECWKDTPEGSIRPWTNLLNTFYFIFCTFGTIIVLWFPIPAVWQSSFFFLGLFWIIVVLLFLFLTIRTIILGIQLRKHTPIAVEPKTRWVDLELPKKEISQQENELEVVPKHILVENQTENSDK